MVGQWQYWSAKFADEAHEGDWSFVQGCWSYEALMFWTPKMCTTTGEKYWLGEVALWNPAYGWTYNIVKRQYMSPESWQHVRDHIVWLTNNCL